MPDPETQPNPYDGDDVAQEDYSGDVEQPADALFVDEIEED